MAKKHAVIFGINYRGSGNDLNGCLNDAAYMEGLAKSKNYDSVHVLTEEQCTKTEMVRALNDRLSACEPGDLFIDTYSAHGTIVLNSQSLVPYDFDFDNPESWLTYDELDRIFMPHEMRGVHIACFHDSCHSEANPTQKWRELNPHPMKNRFLPPPQFMKDRMVSDPFERNVLTSPNFIVLLSGCRKDQYSADAYIDGSYHGAFTYSLSVAYSADPTIDYFTAVLKSRAWLANNSYDQVPGIDGNESFKSRVFFE